ncbi:MAG: PadR family transcriptional regulator [Candidatus Lokiarchaeota archaeon]|nr:PadR family transcriptional regulator [Candidatus Lokiarchaeota archaeon]
MTEGFIEKWSGSGQRKADGKERQLSFKAHPGGKLQFEILKALNRVPRHGYEIFQILKEKALIGDRSDVYKAIRAMKARGLVGSTVAPSNRGYPKEILHLTEPGKDAYVQHVIDSLRENEAMMSERLASTCGLTMMQIVSMYIDTTKQPLLVLVDNDYGSHDRVLPLMRRLFEPARDRVSITVRGLETASEWVVAEAARDGIDILQHGGVVEDGSIDIVASIGIQERARFHSKLDGGGQSWLDMLRPGGLLLAIFFKEENRPCCARYDLLADEFTGAQKRRFLDHFQLDATAPRYKPAGTVSNKDVVERLAEGFAVVDCLTVMDFFDVFIARKGG